MDEGPQIPQAPLSKRPHQCAEHITSDLHNAILFAPAPPLTRRLVTGSLAQSLLLPCSLHNVQKPQIAGRGLALRTGDDGQAALRLDGLAELNLRVLGQDSLVSRNFIRPKGP